MKLYSYSLVFIIILVFSCKSVDENAFTQFSEAPLFGMIYDMESSPVVGALIVLDNKQSAKTDINGRVLFGEVSRGDHSVVINKKGFEEVQMVLNFSNRDQVLYSSLFSLQNILDNLESAMQIDKMLEAKLFLKRASKINSDDIRLKYLNVVYLTECMEFKEAYGAIVLLQKKFPDDPYLIMTQVKILHYGLGKKEEALELLKGSLQSNINKELEILMEEMTSEIKTEKIIGESND